MKLLRALKDGYLNRRILLILFKGIILWVVSWYVSFWLVGGFIIGPEILTIPLGLGMDGLLFSITVAIGLWMTIGVFFYPVSLFYWYYLTRDRSLDGLSNEHRYAILRDKEFWANWRRLGCIGGLFFGIWDLIKFLFIGELLALTWIFWVKKTLTLYY